MSDREYLIRLPWPAPNLWQNRRPHWTDRAKATATAKLEAWALAKERGIHKDPTAILEFSFHPPPRARPDLQNLPATQKAAIDGIAQAMGCDDRLFTVVWPVTFGDRTKGGSVLVHIKPWKEKV